MLNFPSRVLQAVGGLLQPHTETETQTMFLNTLMFVQITQSKGRCVGLDIYSRATAAGLSSVTKSYSALVYTSVPVRR